MYKQEVSFVNVILCILVMWIHIASVGVTTLPQQSGLFLGIYTSWRLSAFVVQGFLFLSALKFFRNMKQKPFHYGSFLHGRIKKILIPYIIAVIVSYIGLIWLQYYKWNWKFLIHSLFVGNMMSPFYFVVILFQFYILMPFWRWVVNHVPVWFAGIFAMMSMECMTGHLPTIISWIVPEYTFLYNDRVFTTYLGYWVLGCYAGKYYETWISQIQKMKSLMIVCFLFFACINVYLSYCNATGIQTVPFLEDVHILYVWFAIIVLFLLGNQIAEIVMKYKIMKGINGMSFYFYLYHAIFLYVIQDKCLISDTVPPTETLLLWRTIFCYGAVAIIAYIYWFWQYWRKEHVY